MAKRTVKARTTTAQSAKRSKPAAKKPTPKSKAAAAAKKSPKKAATTRTLKARATSKGRPAATSKAASGKAAAKKAAVKKPASRKAVAKKRPIAAKKPAAKVVKVVRKRAKKPAGKKAALRNRLSSIDVRRRELEEMVPSPPSSLNMNRRSSAARTGREEMAEHRADHATMTPSITGGDVDANVEDAYFTGDEAPGGDNSTPDQDIVDDIGKALGVEYQDNEELQGANKLEERDKHRWELDPASAEDYRDRDKD